MNSKKKKKFTKMDIIGLVFIIVFLPIIIFNIIVLIQKISNPNKLPKVFGIATLNIGSDSMNIEYGNPGAFNKNDFVFIKNIDVNNLVVNDIIAYRDKDNKIIVHRIIDKDVVEGENVFITKGDNTPDKDSPVYYDQVEGIYIGRIPKIGKVVEFIQKPVGTIILISGLVVVYLLVDFLTQKNNQSKEDNKQEELELELTKLKEETEKLKKGE